MRLSIPKAGLAHIETPAAGPSLAVKLVWTLQGLADLFTV